MTEKKIEKVIIIGGGPAGLTAWIYTSRAWLSPLLFEGFMAEGVAPGGLLTMTSVVENFPGFDEWIRGGELMQKMKKQAQKFWTTILTETVTKVEKSESFFTVTTDKKVYFSYTLIVATWSKPKMLWIPGEKKFWQKWISVCAVCDGMSPLFKKGRVAIVGGGDVAMEEALFMSNIADKVDVFVRKNILKATQYLQERVQKNEKIEIHFNSEVIEAQGENILQILKIKNNQTGMIVEESFQGLFYALGRNPNSSLFTNRLQMDENGFIQGGEKGKTSQKGIFVAWEVSDSIYQQAITSSAQGAQAAFWVVDYLQEIWQF